VANVADSRVGRLSRRLSKCRLRRAKQQRGNDRVTARKDHAEHHFGSNSIQMFPAIYGLPMRRIHPEDSTAKSSDFGA
jgi:hypothetical protein